MVQRRAVEEKGRDGEKGAEGKERECPLTMHVAGNQPLQQKQRECAESALQVSGCLKMMLSLRGRGCYSERRVEETLISPCQLLIRHPGTNQDWEFMTGRLWIYCTISIDSPWLVTHDSHGEIQTSPRLAEERDRPPHTPVKRPRSAAPCFFRRDAEKFLCRESL
jgi:hypothetical protein